MTASFYKFYFRGFVINRPNYNSKYYIDFYYNSKDYMPFFISNTFVSNARVILEKNQANAKQHPEAELLLFENYSHSSFTLSPKNNRAYSKK